MKKYLFLAEKPSLMRDVQSVYKKHLKEVNDKVGEIEFIALAGHMCRLLDPKEYLDWDDKWANLTLPLIPPTFKIAPIADAYKKSILKDIKEKSKTYDGIIVGTDPDVEGNGIYYLIEQNLGLSKKQALRYWYDDQTEKNLLKGLLTLTDYHKNPRDVRMTQSYLIRSHIDWLIGMNFTIGMTVKSNFLMKVGRVKAPTLQIVYNNCKAIDEFTAKTDYELVEKYKQGFDGTYIEESNSVRFTTKKEALDFSKKLSNKAKVISIETKKAKTYAPNLYTLSALQTDAGSKYGLSPKETLDIVQFLYESPQHLVTYPRTDGAYVSTEKAKDFPDLLNTVKSISDLKKFADKVSAPDIAAAAKNERYVNDAKAAKASHDALLPTTTKPDFSKLNDKQIKVYMLICKRFLSIFMEPLTEEKTVLLADNSGYTFKTNGKKTLIKGWTDLYDKKSEDTLLPPVKKDNVLDITGFDAVEKTTTPPTRLTQATLIQAMENVQKFITEKEYKDVLKLVHGIGMQSSRAAIIDDLIKTGYMEEKGKGKGLYITDSGKAYIKNLSGLSIVSPILTAQWEQKMGEIRDGSRRYEDVEAEMLDFVKETTKEIQKKTVETHAPSAKGTSSYKCPYCGKSMIKGPYGYFCAGRKEGCKFVVPAVVASKKLTEGNVKTIIEKGETGLIKGFKSKAGKSFDAKLKRKNDGVEFDFNK